MIKKYLKNIKFLVYLKYEHKRWKISLDWFLLNNLISIFPSHTIRKAFLRFKGASIHNHSIIYGGCEFRSPEGLKIGSGSSIGHRAVLDARMGLEIGKNVVLATDVMIWTLHHDYDSAKFESKGSSVKICDNVWLGSRVIILPGITIGKGAVVAAGSLVSKNVDPFSVVGGIPAKVISKRKIQEFNYDPAAFRMHMV